MMLVCSTYRNRRLLLILFGCIACFTVTFLVWPREREPKYNGIALSDWLEGAGRLMRTRPRPAKPVHSWSEATGSEFNTAIRHMGTNALPGLLLAVQYQTP